MKNYKMIGAALVAVLWLGLAAYGWLLPSREASDAERRKLRQFPELSAQTLLNGKFMSEFEDYTLDQFPLRDSFRKLKAAFHYNVLGQKDNNDIFICEGYAAQLEYPLNETSVSNALEKFEAIYENYLKDTGSAVYTAVVPDKSMYLQMSGYLTMDYVAMYKMVESGMPYAQFVNLADSLGLEDYYRTDTHWRQESLLEAAQRLCEAMGVTAPQQEEFSVTALQRPFYGVYYGQAALPMEPETMYILESDWLRDCTVTNFETGEMSKVYDMTKLESKDLYDVFLSGAVSLLTIDNPQGQQGKELIVFRDSFGSSMIPLLIRDYSKVTVIDIRYISSDLLSQFVEFGGQDVLFLHSTLVLNSSGSLK